jgi:capping protein alpha
MSKATEIASAFIGGAPPGELADVVNDIEALTIENPSLHDKLGPAFQKYNEEQLVTAKLPGSSEAVSLSYALCSPRLTAKQVLLSKYNRLPDGRYFDVGHGSSWAYDHANQVSIA